MKISVHTEKGDPMDNLARNAMLAKQAGMSYGQWKALQAPVKIEKKAQDGWKVCEYCGKAFKHTAQGRKKYCEPYCQKMAYAEKDKQIQAVYRKRKAAEKNKD
jgi:uncharacterized paraquat-inducible protein A